MADSMTPETGEKLVADTYQMPTVSGDLLYDTMRRVDRVDYDLQQRVEDCETLMEGSVSTLAHPDLIEGLEQNKRHYEEGAIPSKVLMFS